MSNTTTNITNSNFASTLGEITAPVVQNDTTTSAPSFKLDALGVPVTMRVESSSNAPATVPVTKVSLAAMEQARMSWETTELAASNKRLYSILRDAYSYYLTMKQDPNKGARKDRVIELDRRLVQFAADRVRETGRAVQLEPMTALERRWVHVELQGAEGIVTESAGEEPERRVVVLPA